MTNDNAEVGKNELYIRVREVAELRAENEALAEQSNLLLMRVKVLEEALGLIAQGQGMPVTIDGYPDHLVTADLAVEMMYLAQHVLEQPPLDK